MLKLINKNIDFKSVAEQTQKAEPFPHFCIDNFLDEDFANEIYQAFPAFEDAQKVGREFSTVNEQKKIQITDTAKFPEPILKLHQLLASQEFLQLLEEIMGIPNLLADPDLIGGGIHETNTGGRLDVHVDFNFIEEKKWHRRLNILIYFNKDWKEEYGGYLDIWDKDVKKCYGAFAPIFNRACCFVTSNISYHGVTPLKCPPHIMRKSFAAYYYTKEAPAHYNGINHSTIFKARPDEWVRGNLLMPGESALNQTKEGLQRAKKIIKRLIGK